MHGEGQTDFVPVGVDKGTGLRALAAQLRGRVVLAVGDSTEDVAMFAEAVELLGEKYEPNPIQWICTGLFVVENPGVAALSRLEIFWQTV